MLGDTLNIFFHTVQKCIFARSSTCVALPNYLVYFFQTYIFTWNVIKHIFKIENYLHTIMQDILTRF